MQRILISTAIGGFALNRVGLKYLADNGCALSAAELATPSIGFNVDYYPCFLDRNDPLLLKMFEVMGKDALNEGATAVIVEIPDDTDWFVFEHESGSEAIHERHRVWP